jgi:hypothetical protein
VLDFESPIQGLLGVHSRYGLHTRAVTVYRDTLTRGFSHFVTSMTAPVASGWSGCRVGLAPTGKRRLSTAHTQTRHPEALIGLVRLSKISAPSEREVDDPVQLRTAVWIDEPHVIERLDYAPLGVLPVQRLNACVMALTS